MNLNLDGVDFTTMSEAERYAHYAAVTVELNKRQIAQIEGGYGKNNDGNDKELKLDYDEEPTTRVKNEFKNNKKKGTYVEIQGDKPVKFDTEIYDAVVALIDSKVESDEINVDEVGTETKLTTELELDVCLTDSDKLNNLMKLVPIYKYLFTKGELINIEQEDSDTLKMAVHKLECVFKVFYKD